MKRRAWRGWSVVVAMGLAGCGAPEADAPSNAAGGGIAPAYSPAPSPALPKPGEADNTATPSPAISAPVVAPLPTTQPLGGDDAFPEPSGNASWPAKSGLLKSLGKAISKGVSGAAQESGELPATSPAP